jgi:hypothetical protein
MTYWNDFPRTKNKVAIIGFANTTRHMAPYDDDEYEIWGLNEAYNHNFMPRFDRWFQMHPRWDFTRAENLGDPNHFEWLKSDRDFPIYMQESHADIPNSVKLPLEEMTQLLPEGKKYYASTLAYMLVFALFLGYSDIELYGFEMGTDTEYHYQRANAEYLIGVGQGLGFNITLPEQSGILKGKMYGYEEMITPYRQQLELRQEHLKQQLSKQDRDTARRSGAAEALHKALEEMKPVDELKRKSEVVDDATDNLVTLARISKDAQLRAVKGQTASDFINGALTEANNLTGMYDRNFLVGKEVDETKPEAYKIMQEHVNVEYKN